MSPRPALAALCLAAALLAGCTGGQTGVANVTDSFSYGGQVANKDGTQTYTWQNTQTKAMVSWGGEATSGSFTLTILDSAGKQVYSGSMGAGQNGMTANTASGTAGDWTILLNFHGYTGQMGLAVTSSGTGTYGSTYAMPTYSP